MRSLYGCHYYIHRIIREAKPLEQVLQKQYPRRSESELLAVLECEEFYRILRDKTMSDQDRLAIEEFVSEALTVSEWADFQHHCSNNRLNPYEEMRELIYSAYAKMLRSNVPEKRKGHARRQKN